MHLDSNTCLRARVPGALLVGLALAGCTSGSTNASPVIANPSGGAFGTPSSPDASGTAGTSGVTQSSGGNANTSCAAPGSVPFRVMTRLNRAEYDNTVRDLLGDDSHVVLATLPADFGDGAFDNNAAALNIDPALASQFAALAETLAEKALATNSPGRASIFVCSEQTDACARQIGETFAARAWRRPLRDGESDRLLSLYSATRAAGFSFDQAIQELVTGALTSANFLFRAELDAMPDAPTQHALSGSEVASRLSYFLWSSMPDASLTAAAASGALTSSAGLAEQAERMWQDPKASALKLRFPGLWLRTLDIGISKQPAPEIYPTYDAALETAFEAETARFMSDFVSGDVNFLDFIDAKFSYVNQRLAEFYGLAGRFGEQFVRVDLSGNAQRGGILTQGSFLTLTAAPERTSPVMRGQWVLARLLASPPPPPPANIPSIDAQPSSAGMSMRQRLSAHVSNPACAGCHDLMDPIGFGLENYDGIGAYRTLDNGVPVDASGELNGRDAFNGAFELEALLKKDPRLPRAVVRYLVGYALGRELGPRDECLLSSLSESFQNADKGRFSALVLRVSQLDELQQRRAAP